MSDEDAGALEVLSHRVLLDMIDEAIYYTETNRELAQLGTKLLLRALDIMSTVAEPSALRKAILEVLKDRKNRLILETSTD